MADALMGWDAKQSRWRATYKKIPLQIRASVLGGSNYADTVIAANQWFRQQQARIDGELAVEKLRPNEVGYLAELEEMESVIKPLSTLIRNPAYRSMLVPIVAELKQRVSGIRQILSKTTPTLPPLDDKLRNPLNAHSLQKIEEEAAIEATQIVADDLREMNVEWVSDEEIEDTYDYDGLETLRQRSQWNMYARSAVESAIEDRIQNTAETIVSLQSELVREKKKELGVIDERVRGRVEQMLIENGVAVPENKQLDYHIDKFITYQLRRQKESKITAGRFGKIRASIEYYQQWSSLVSVIRVGTKDHIDAYYTSLSDKKIAGEIKARYARDLFATFKMLILWLVDEGTLSTYPDCLKRKGDRYTFPVNRQRPKVVTQEWVHKILDTANPRLKLFILLTLNCGLGASEIGQLTKEEYDPITGRINHKRHKTERFAKVPTVCYKLWDVTKALLDKEIANRKKCPKYAEFSHCLLVNQDGKPLWSEYVCNDGKSHKSDNITNTFKRLVAKLRETGLDVPSISYYQFRKTSASLIANEPRFRTYNGLWLGHAPQTMGDQAYNALDDTILDDCIAWLHDKIFGTKPPSEGGSVKTDKI